MEPNSISMASGLPTGNSLYPSSEVPPMSWSLDVKGTIYGEPWKYGTICQWLLCYWVSETVIMRSDLVHQLAAKATHIFSAAFTATLHLTHGIACHNLQPCATCVTSLIKKCIPTLRFLIYLHPGVDSASYTKISLPSVPAHWLLNIYIYTTIYKKYIDLSSFYTMQTIPNAYPCLKLRTAPTPRRMPPLRLRLRWRPRDPWPGQRVEIPSEAWLNGGGGFNIFRKLFKLDHFPKYRDHYRGKNKMNETTTQMNSRFAFQQMVISRFNVLGFRSLRSFDPSPSKKETQPTFGIN